ncbi:MAG: hypothetical protein EZS28_007442 [Streblomastix strix]|uniref:Uncharacterized protein n=1 Tax=Streblomastix strix TaxID=222440 RepID=A0A5J4WPT5_9EUKA|nr:MAG: hypothetical protein EZS28_007442 [Streblomastix strix]
MVDPNGEGPLPEFATVYTNKGKLYSMGGYIPKDEIPRNHFLATYVPTIANEFKGTNKIEKWGKREYMAAASATRKEIWRELIEEIDPVHDWAGASDAVLKQAASHFKKQIINLYFAKMVENEDGFVRIMDQVYQQVAGNAIAQTRRKLAGRMEVD